MLELLSHDPRDVAPASRRDAHQLRPARLALAARQRAAHPDAFWKPDLERLSRAGHHRPFQVHRQSDDRAPVHGRAGGAPEARLRSRPQRSGSLRDRPGEPARRTQAPWLADGRAVRIHALRAVCPSRSRRGSRFWTSCFARSTGGGSGLPRMAIRGAVALGRDAPPASPCRSRRTRRGAGWPTRCAIAGSPGSCRSATTSSAG